MWETCPRGINVGGWGLNIQTEGLAKFGQLYWQKGSWRGRQILPARWVEEASTFKIQQPPPANPSRPKEQNDWLQGYCYQFWRWQRGETALPGTPPRLISGGAPKAGTKSKLAASGTWKDETTFEMTWRYYETPHHDTVSCRFDGTKVQIAFMSSIAQMSATPKDKRPILQGQMMGQVSHERLLRGHFARHRRDNQKKG